MDDSFYPVPSWVDISHPLVWDLLHPTLCIRLSGCHSHLSSLQYQAGGEDKILLNEEVLSFGTFSIKNPLFLLESLGCYFVRIMTPYI